jgi:hypothetical protein
MDCPHCFVVTAPAMVCWNCGGVLPKPRRDAMTERKLRAKQRRRSAPPAHVDELKRHRSPEPDDSVTAKAQHEAFWGELEREGRAVCGCCGKQTKRIKRTMSDGLAKALGWLVHAWRENRKCWVPRKVAPKWVTQHNDITRLQLWGLIEVRKGSWRPTTLGVEWFEGRVSVPSHVFEIRSVVESVSVDTVRFRSVLPTWDQIKHEVVATWAGNGGV